MFIEKIIEKQAGNYIFPGNKYAILAQGFVNCRRGISEAVKGERKIVICTTNMYKLRFVSITFAENQT